MQGNCSDQCYTYYSYVYKAANSGDLNDLQTAIQTVLGFDLKFEDKSIKDAATDKAMKGLKKAVKAMLNAYEDYLEDLASGGKTVRGSYQINCPVNVSVYNSAGERIGYVGTDDIWYSEEIRIRDLGGAKQILVYSDDILSFEMVAA